MAKKFYLITKISKDKYLELMAEAGHEGERNFIRQSVSGSAPIKKDGNKQRFVAYTSDNGLEILVSE